MPLGVEVGLIPGDFMLDGNSAPPPKFSAHVYCDQTAGWIKMAVSIEVGLSPGDFMLDGDPTPLDPSPIFSPFLLWPND